MTSFFPILSLAIFFQLAFLPILSSNIPTKNILVLPTQNNFPPPQNAFYQNAIQSLIITSLSFSKIQIVSPSKSKNISQNLPSQNLPSQKLYSQLIQKKIQFVLFSNLKKYSHFYQLSFLLVNPKTQNIVFKDKHQIPTPNPQNQPLFKNQQILPETFLLINPLLQKLSHALNPNPQNKYPNIQLMFVFYLKNSFYHQTLQLKNLLPKIVAYVKSFHQNANVTVSFFQSLPCLSCDQYSIFPFTSDVSKIQASLDPILETYSNPQSSIQYHPSSLNQILAYALKYDQWSSHQNDKKILFLLTNQAKNNQHAHQLFIMPFQFSNVPQNIQSNLRKKLFSHLAMKKDHLSISRPLELFFQNQLSHHSNPNQLIQIISRLYPSVRYFIQLSIKKINEQYILSLNINDHWYKQNVFQSKININQKISNFNPSNLKKDLLIQKIIQNIESYFFNVDQSQQQPHSKINNIQTLIQLAKSRQIKIYSINSDEISEKNHRLLKKITHATQGNHQCLSYEYSAYLKNQQNQKVRFIYHNHHLYQSFTKIPLGARINQILSRSINLKKNLKNVQESQNFLINEKYPVHQNSLTKIKNNFLKIMQSFIKSGHWNQKTEKHLLLSLKSDGYLLPIKISGWGKLEEYQKLKSWIGQNITLSARIFPSLEYLVDYWQNNRWIKKNILFRIEPKSVKIFHSNNQKFVSPYLEKKIREINNSPFFYQKYGLGKQKYWFIQGKIINITKITK